MIKVFLLVSLALVAFSARADDFVNCHTKNEITACTRASESGDKLSAEKLAIIYKLGIGTSKDIEKHIYWTRKAAELGSSRAQMDMGRLYDSGRFVEQNNTEAVRWFRAAAEQGLATGHSRLGMAYASGKGLKKDPLLAYMWFETSINEGYHFAIVFRDKVAEELSAGDVAKAKQMAIACKERSFKDCD